MQPSYPTRPYPTRPSYSAATTSSLPVHHSTVPAPTSMASASMATSSSSSVIDSNHPYFLHNGDNPGTPLVTQLLNEQNYQQWSRSVKLALSAKLKLGLIDGTLPKPAATDRSMYAMWNRCNDMVISWLLNSITPEIRSSVVYFSTAKGIWDDLAVRFSQSNVPRIFQLKKDLTSLSQGSLSITTYFTRFRALIDEIDDLSPIPRCSCVKSNCACGYSLKLDNYEQIHKLSQFLMGLNDQFTGIRGQLLMMTPLPTLSQAYSLLLQEEVQRDCTSQCQTTDNVALNVRFSGSKQRPASNAPAKKSAANDSTYCDFCHSTGHTQEKCFYLHGYPDWHRLYGQPKPKPRSGAQSTVRKVAQVTNSSPPIQSASGEDVQSTSVFTEAQCHQLANMIQSSIKALSPWNAPKSEPASPLIGNISSYAQGPTPEEENRDW